MSVNKYSPVTTIVVLNAKKLADWGAEEQPIRIRTMNPKRELAIHTGGGGVIGERINEGREVTLYLRPGSKDSSTLSGLYDSGDLLEMQMTTINTGEKIILSGGVVADQDEISRGIGASDDVYTLQFLESVVIMGGSN